MARTKFTFTRFSRIETRIMSRLETTTEKMRELISEFCCEKITARNAKRKYQSIVSDFDHTYELYLTTLSAANKIDKIDCDCERYYVCDAACDYVKQFAELCEFFER